jgi:hypothetical protein
MITIQITSCKDCPFFVNEDRAEYCNVPIVLYAVDTSEYKIPNNCPLKTESIRVKIKGRE